MIDEDIGALDVREDRYAEYERLVDQAHDRLVFAHPGMSNWYKNSRGRVVVPSPWRLVDYWWMTLRPKLEDFSVTPAPSLSVPVDP
jgi:4-hydroxyacetophenone monooxygenase